ncbi:unnamed protein product [Absidia cylindrospora]
MVYEDQKAIRPDIPIHIVSNVNTRQASLEEQLSKQHGSTRKQQGRRGYAGASLDLGMTIDSAKTSSTSKSNNNRFLTRLQRRYENEKHHLQQSHHLNKDSDSNDQQPQRAMAEAEAYALLRKGTTTNTESTHKDGDGQNSDSNDDQLEKENSDVSGRDMFGFSTTRRRPAITMMKKVIQHDVSAQEDNKKVSNSGLKKRGRPPKRTANVDVLGTKDKRRRLERKTGRDNSILRGNNGDDDKDDSDDDEDDDKEQSHQQEGSLLDEAAGYERYFQDLHGSSKTSNNTMSKLPMLEPQEFQSILEAVPTKHGPELAKLTAHHEQHFPQWFFELQSGFNLVFYGFGSKRQLINKFAMQVMKDGPLIIANGFFPTITIKDIMTKILVGALEAPSLPGTLQEQLAMVVRYFKDEARGYKRLYLVVHNMDGMNLRNEHAQSALATLAESDNIHLVGSIDQINAGLLWDNVKSTRFNWLYHDASTFDNYLVETSFENTLLMGLSENGSARGVKHVLASLTSNGRGIFKVLAEYQLLEMEVNNLDRGTEQVGLSYHQYYENCREQFFVSTETGMRSQLTEFKDHKVMVTKRLADGTELLYMPLDKSTLMGIVENMD